MNQKRAVITGIGVVSPAGNNIQDMHGGLVSGMRFVREIDRFDASRYPARHAGLVDDTGAAAHFSRRLLKKLDLFSEMSLVSAKGAIDSAGLDMDAEDMERMGVIIGNALGGWGFAEVELRDLYNGGLRDVSPYQATAWFPAAPQGQVSIHYGIKGFSKTIISDIASSLLAIGYAARTIRAGRADVVLAGGAEAPVSPYALLCCNTSGELSRSGRYAPFDKSRDGYVLAEGAAVLVVEQYERAKARGAKIYAEISGFGHTSDGVDPKGFDTAGRGMARAMKLALAGTCRENAMTAGDIGYLMPAGLGGVDSDTSEANAIREVFGGLLDNGLAVGIPRSQYGNPLGASGALDCAVACASMDRNEMPTSTGCESPEDGWSWAGGGVVSSGKPVDGVMVNSMGRGGVNVSVVLKKIRQ